MSLQDHLDRMARDRAAGVAPRVYNHPDPPAPRGAAPRTPLPIYGDCAHGGTDADVEEECATCGGMGHVRTCKIHGLCTWGPSNYMSCVRCRADGRGYAPANPAPGAALVIDHGASGIGDALLGLLAVGALAAPVEYRVSFAAKPFVALFDGYTTLAIHARGHSEAPVVGARQLNLGYAAEARDRYPVPRWERYARNAGAMGIRLPKLRDPEGVRAAGADLAGRVALLPFATERSREWSLQHWLTLEQHLIARGYDTVALHSDAGPLAAFAGAKVAGASAERVAGVLLNATCAVGNDSGLAHLAAVMGAPTVVLGGQTPVAQIFGAYPTTVALQGQLRCSGCAGGAPFDARCQASCANVQSVTPERVREEVDRIVLPRIIRGKSLLCPGRLVVLRDTVLATSHLPGALAEAGAYRGGSAKLIAHYARGARLHVFDALGLPATDTAPGGAHRAGEFAGDESELRELFAGDNIALHLGTFPGTARDLPADLRFRFVHLDLDTYESTRDALRWFWPRIIPGGVIVLDDLDWKDCPGVRLALTGVLPGVEAEMPERHQGVIRKA